MCTAPAVTKYSDVTELRPTWDWAQADMGLGPGITVSSFLHCFVMECTHDVSMLIQTILGTATFSLSVL